MKKYFTSFVLLFSFILPSMAAWETAGTGILQDGVWYALYSTDEAHFSTISSKEYNLQAPAESLTYEAKCVPIQVIIEYYGGDLKVAEYVNGKYGDALFSQQPPKNSYAAYGPIALSQSATKIKLYTEIGATGHKYMKNVFATMASYLYVSQFGKQSDSYTYEPAILNSPSQHTFRLYYSNADKFAGALSVTCSNELSFAVSELGSTAAGSYGYLDLDVTYLANELGTQTAEITISDGANYSVSLSLSASSYLPTTYGEYDAAICPGDSVEYNGVYYKEAGVYPDILLPVKNHFGGDSLVNLTLHVLPSYDLTDEPIVLEEGTEEYWHDVNLSLLPVGDTLLVDSLQTELGCDSVSSVLVTVTPKEVGPVTSFSTTTLAPAATKFFRGGALYIRRDEALFDLRGARVE